MHERLALLMFVFFLDGGGRSQIEVDEATTFPSPATGERADGFRYTCMPSAPIGSCWLGQFDPVPHQELPCFGLKPISLPRADALSR